jgi:ribose transport system ATP-binding protein
MGVEGLSVAGALEDVSFDLRRGEILGFFGLAGSGRTEVAEALMGLRRGSSGAITVKGMAVDVKNPSEAMERGISYLSEDRREKGLILDFGIVHNVTLSSLDDYCSYSFVDQDEEYLKAESYVDELGIKAASLYSNLEFFSGGNQQKVSLAKSLDSAPDVLIADEPTRGVDVNARRDMYRFIKKLTDNGLSCLYISSDIEEIIGMCNRVVVMHGGRIRSILEGDDVSEEKIMFHASGFDVIDATVGINLGRERCGERV